MLNTRIFKLCRTKIISERTFSYFVRGSLDQESTGQNGSAVRESLLSTGICKCMFQKLPLLEFLHPVKPEINLICLAKNVHYGLNLKRIETQMKNLFDFIGIPSI